MQVQIPQEQKNWKVELSNENGVIKGVIITSLFYSEEYAMLLLEGRNYYTLPDGTTVEGKDKYQMKADNTSLLPIVDKVTKEPKLDENDEPLVIGELDAWLMKYHAILSADIIPAIQRREKVIETPLQVEQ